MDKGWIKLNRQIQDHWIWDDPEKLKAWIDLIMLANIESKKCVLREGVVTIRRGQFVTSISKLAVRWKWSRDRVRRFLILLEQDSMIVRKSDTYKTTLTIVNYSKFQGERNSDNTTNKTTDKAANNTTDKTRLKNIKNGKELKEGGLPTSTVAAAQEDKDDYVGMTDEEWEALERFT